MPDTYSYFADYQPTNKKSLHNIRTERLDVRSYRENCFGLSREQFGPLAHTVKLVQSTIIAANTLTRSRSFSLRRRSLLVSLAGWLAIIILTLTTPHPAPRAVAPPLRVSETRRQLTCVA